MTPDEENQLDKWAQSKDIPVAVDVQSHLRGNGKCLRYTDWTIENLPSNPDSIFWFGGVFQSKRVHRFLKSTNATIIQFQNLNGRVKREDDLHLQKTSIHLESIGSLLERVSVSGVEANWKESLAQLDQKARTFFSKQFANQQALSEPSIARTVASVLPPNAFLMSGSSRPIRDLDSYAEGWPQLFANRGASGIDGNISTFAGLCEGMNSPGVLLLGDLATIHDLNAFGLIKKISSPAAIVLVDNDGGGIFHFLSVHSHQLVPGDVFEKYFGSPHGLRLDKIIEGFEIPLVTVKTCQDLERELSKALTESGCKVLYLKTNRNENRDEHMSLRQEWSKWFSSTDS
jgi:2-succinyl-5-enolpyruvyl-6-hydroxy-3-cyclohexene-1-carboxylate synthase